MDVAVAEARDHLPDGPVAVVGYSFGALVASQLTDDGIVGWVLIAPPFGMGGGVAGHRRRGPARSWSSPRPTTSSARRTRPEPPRRTRVDTTVEEVPGADHFLAAGAGRRGPAGRGGHCRTVTPAAAMAALASATVCSPKWKIDAASTASASPSTTPSTRCCSVADAAAGDHRHRHGVAHGLRQAEVEAVAGAVAVHRREQDLAGAQLDHPRRPLDGVHARSAARAAVR